MQNRFEKLEGGCGSLRSRLSRRRRSLSPEMRSARVRHANPSSPNFLNYSSSRTSFVSDPSRLEYQYLVTRLLVYAPPSETRDSKIYICTLFAEPIRHRPFFTPPRIIIETRELAFQSAEERAVKSRQSNCEWEGRTLRVLKFENIHDELAKRRLRP